MNIFQRFEELLATVAETVLEKAGNKPSRKDVWNQTVAFLASHGDKKMQGIHAENKAKEQSQGKPFSGKAAAAEKPKGPSRPGSARGEVARVKGKIVNKKVSYPLKDGSGKETGERGFRHMNAQEVHHFKWDGGKWEHTHTTEEGQGLNSKDR